MASEDEEFEFRRRAEAEAAAAHDAKPQMPNLGDFGRNILEGAGHLADKYGRPTLQTGGAVAGGVLAAPVAALAGLATGGPGAAAVETGGVGLGSALGGNYYDELRGLLTGQKSPPLSQQLATGLSDFSTGASVVPGGRLVGGALSKAGPAIRGVGQRLAGVLDAGVTPARQGMVTAAKSALAQQMEPLDQTITTASRARQLAASLADQAAAAKAADADLRPPMVAAAAARADEGVSPIDTPQAKALVEAIKAKLNPTGEVGTILRPAQVKPYESVLDVLDPERIGNGPKPDLASIQALRREITKPAYTGGQTGFDAIPKSDRKMLAKVLNGVEDAYTDGLQAPVQANYTKALDLEAQAKDAVKATKVTDKAAASATKAKQVYAAQMESLTGLPPADASQQAVGIMRGLREKNLISSEQHDDFLRQLTLARTAQQKSAAYKTIAKTIAAGAGLGLIGEGAHVTGILP